MPKFNFGSLMKNPPSSPKEVTTLNNGPSKSPRKVTKSPKKVTKSKNTKITNNLQIHVLNERNFFKFFLMKKTHKVKPYELYYLFLNTDLDLNNQIDNMLKKFCQKRLLLRNKDGWYYPNPSKMTEIKKILKGGA